MEFSENEYIYNFNLKVVKYFYMNTDLQNTSSWEKNCRMKVTNLPITRYVSHRLIKISVQGNKMQNIGGEAKQGNKTQRCI